MGMKNGGFCWVIKGFTNNGAERMESRERTKQTSSTSVNFCRFTPSLFFTKQKYNRDIDSKFNSNMRKCKV